MQNTQIQEGLVGRARGMLRRSTSVMQDGSVPFTDAFSAIFEQMALALSDNSGGVMQLAGNGQEGESDLSSDQELMMQMIGEMLQTNPAAVSSLPQIVQNQTIQQSVAVPENQTSAVAGLVMADTSVQAAAQTTVLSGEPALQNMVETKQTGGQIIQQPVLLQEMEQTDEVMVNPPKAQADTGDPFEAQSKFYQSVHEARGLLQGKNDTEKAAGKEQQLDIDQLQNDVETNRFNPIALAKVKTTATETVPDLSTQIQQGITENLEKGSKEFVLKLKPEGLGEITVKLLEKEGKTTLSLTASTAEVAKIINNDLTALRNALRPLHVEVHEAVPQQSAPSQEQQTAFHVSQQFGAFAQPNPGGRHSSGGHEQQVFTDSGETVPEDVLENEEVLAESALDTYI